MRAQLGTAGLYRGRERRDIDLRSLVRRHRRDPVRPHIKDSVFSGCCRCRLLNGCRSVRLHGGACGSQSTVWNRPVEPCAAWWNHRRPVTPSSVPVGGRLRCGTVPARAGPSQSALRPPTHSPRPALDESVCSLPRRQAAADPARKSVRLMPKGSDGLQDREPWRASLAAAPRHPRAREQNRRQESRDGMRTGSSALPAGAMPSRPCEHERRHRAGRATSAVANCDLRHGARWLELCYPCMRFVEAASLAPEGHGCDLSLAGGRLGRSCPRACSPSEHFRNVTWTQGATMAS